MLMLIAAVTALTLWVILTFVTPLGVGAVHLLLGIGAVLLVRWWALRDPAR